MINIDRLNEQQLEELNKFLSEYVQDFIDSGEVKEKGIWYTNNISPASMFQIKFDNWKQEWGQSIKFR
jgi:hypothetical protein|tara:strand:+ start:47 stop:250 length:204 start_codon:yes stop_codon:yes gene_type:complete